MSPRSILKHSSPSYTNTGAQPLATALPYHPPPPQVHFPPTPALTQTRYTFSGSTYDRAPIEVMPNDCAMPARGCRIYNQSRSDGGRSPASGGKHPHPRVADASADGRIPQYGPSGPAPHYPSSSMPIAARGPPPLVPDISSESDESDGIVSPPPEYYNHHEAKGGHGYSQGGYSNYGVNVSSHHPEQLNKALAFLPHPAPEPKPKREKERRRREPSRFKSEDASRSFAASSLDGCLGGF